MFRLILFRFLFVVAVLVVCAAAPAAERDRTKNGPTNSEGVPIMADGRIDLFRADPSQVDLAKIHPDKLHLTKQVVRKLDMSKWDLSKIDTNQVKDPLAAKWIIKRLQQAKSRATTLSAYEPGELKRLQNEKLQWLRDPAPYVEPELTRQHRLSRDEILRCAKVLDEVLLDKLHETNQDFNQLTSDEQFVRRIYISVAGRIPTAQEAAEFLADRRATKRQDLIDQLLLSEDYPLQMFNWLADMLRIRDLKSNQGENVAYQQWLIDQMASNRPWSEIVYDLLTAEGDLVTNPTVGWLVRDAGNQLGGLANTLTTFMGASVSCAECHDHPFNEYTQRDFYQMAAFFGAVEVGDKNVRAAPKVLKNRYHFVATRPDRFLTFSEDYAYGDVEPSSRVTPKFATRLDSAPRLNGTEDHPLDREDFALWMTNKSNLQFAATIANRLCGKIFGVPVMTPVTEMDDLETAHNPRLIKTIAKLMQQVDFDLIAFQRVLYNTRAYQAQASVSPEVGEPYDYPGPTLRRMTAEEAWDSIVTLMKGDRVNQYHRERRVYVWSQDVFEEGIIDYVSEIQSSFKEEKVSRKIELERLVSEAAKRQSQLFSSVGASRKVRRADPDEFIRASERRQPEVESHFLRQFGQAERELADTGTLEGDIPQTLMLMNGPVGKSLGESGSYVMQEAERLSNAAAQIDFVYMSFLGRKPTPSERKLINSESIPLGDLCWMLMNSHEFMFVQ